MVSVGVLQDYTRTVIAIRNEQVIAHIRCRRLSVSVSFLRCYCCALVDVHLIVSAALLVLILDVGQVSWYWI